MNKEQKTEITKQKLLDACDALITGSDDPMKVTSRQIAAKSGVQAAMINYCFGSREKLIFNVFMCKYKNALEDADVRKIVTSRKSPKNKLKELHFVIASFLVKNYQFTKAITSFVLFERDLSQPSFSYGLVKEHFKGKKTDTECRMIAYELSTMLQLVLYRKDDMCEYMGLDLDEERQLRKYIDMRVDLLLP